jgi:large subunit ribosomal protein L25
MQENFEINAVSRGDQGKGASRRLRREGMVPGIIYGGGVDPEMFATKHNELIQHLDHEAFYSHILTVNMDGKAQKVVLKDLHRHPAKPFLLHVDFLRVSRDEKLRLTIPIHFVNEQTCRGVKMGGQVSHNVTEIEVSCLPADLPEFLSVDMAEMDVGDSVHVSELELPERVELTQSVDPETTVVSIYTPQAESAGSEEDAEGAAEPDEGAAD